jgi:hypothetical protein
MNRKISITRVFGLFLKVTPYDAIIAAQLKLRLK